MFITFRTSVRYILVEFRPIIKHLFDFGVSITNLITEFRHFCDTIEQMFDSDVLVG